MLAQKGKFILLTRCGLYWHLYVLVLSAQLTQVISLITFTYLESNGLIDYWNRYFMGLLIYKFLYYT